jgi:hypothetical protein
MLFVLTKRLIELLSLENVTKRLCARMGACVVHLLKEVLLNKLSILIDDLRVCDMGIIVDIAADYIINTDAFVFSIFKEISSLSFEIIFSPSFDELGLPHAPKMITSITEKRIPAKTLNFSVLIISLFNPSGRFY